MNKNLTMENDYMENSVKITLCFSGDEVPLETISAILEIEPTSTRKKSEWRVQNEYACDEWEFQLKEMVCPDVEKLFREFIEMFRYKIDDIKRICHDYNCTVSIVVVIHMENCAQPYTFLSPGTIDFLCSINAEIIMDIWGYDTGEGEGYDTGDIRMNYMKCIK